MQQPLDQVVQEIAKSLIRLRWRIVFAESCTGGLVSATLARLPGISNFLCGSAVVYRLDTKTRWLAVQESMLIEHGPVSEPVARAMAEGALMKTPEADVSASVTGHLGPNAPEHQDGLIFVAIAVRGRADRVYQTRLPKLETTAADERFPGQNGRERRQWAAAEFVLGHVNDALRAEFVVSDRSAELDNQTTTSRSNL